MQTDGNFVVYDTSVTPHKALWHTHTNGTGANRIAMQSDGNLVVYQGSTAKWASSTNPASNARLVMQDDGNLVIYSRGGVALWSWKGGNTANRTDSLLAGSKLAANNSLWSRSGRYQAVMQTDGNFVVYDTSVSPSKALWSSKTNATGADRFAVQTDGNLVVYAGATAKWSSGTRGGQVRLVMQDDGNLVLYSRGGLALWSSKGGKTGFAEDTLPRGATLTVGKSLWSRDGRYYAVMQGDGNFVVYGPGGAKWSSRTNGTGANRVVMQGDGNLVVYDGGTAEWNSGTRGGNTRLVMQSDGNLVVYDGGTAKWASHSNGAPGTSDGGDASVLTRAQSWVDAAVPYSQSGTYTNQYGSYRPDCSGYVSMAWSLDRSYNTTTLRQVSHQITKSNLSAGDILLSPSHAVIFAKWANAQQTEYWAYEQINYGYVATYHKIPYPYWSQYDSGFQPFRKN